MIGAQPRAGVGGGVRGAVRRHRAAALVVLLVVATAVLLALLRPRTDESAFTPESVDPGGGRALARVLADRGVTVTEARTFADASRALSGGAGGDATVLVTAPDLLSDARLRTLAGSGADVVLLRPSEASLAAFTDDVTATGRASTATRDPGCADPDAVAAGPVRAGGLTYAASGGATACYGGSFARAGLGRATLTVLGQPTSMTNRWVAQEGNAALALRTLGAHRDLVWYLPDPADTESARVPLTALLPPWTWPAVGVVALATGFVLLWRGRRLGRLVDEPLPVVVRAAETVEGHGRLYASARACARAAQALREATLRRLRGWTGLDARADVADVADQVAWITGRSAPAVRELLAGSAPADDPALVRLAVDLDALEHDVRSTSPGGAVHP